MPDNDAPTQHNSSSQADRLDEVVAGYLRAVERGESPNREELRTRHPDLADELREFFADHDRMADLARPLLEPTINQNVSGTPPSRIRYFGDYELLEEIARGGMGVVYKARQVRLNRVVAVKMILSGQLASPADVERFHTEAEAAAKLDHPGIVPIYEVGQHDGQHYFSMGFVEGQSLSACVAQGPLPAREAAEIVRTVAEAVQYAHDKGVIHRDLKPGNILLDRQGKPRVTDFGLAKLTESVSELTGTGQILGTPGYMPPEQAAAHVGAVGPLSDIYSLGAILYCVLTGRPPFQAATPIETLLQVQNQEPLPPRQLNPAIPVDLDTIVLKCLEKSPIERYATAQHLAQDLGRYLSGEPITARPISSLARLARWCRRKPTVAALSAASIVATAVAVVALVTSRAAVSLALRERITAFKKLELEEQKVRGALAEKTEALERERHARVAEAEQRAEVERQKRLVEGQRDRAQLAEHKANEEKKHARRSEADTQAFSDFLVFDVLSVARPERVQGGLGVDVTVAQALEAAEENLAGRFPGRPLAEATARDAIGKTWRNLGKNEQAERHLRRAVELREQELGPDDPATLDSRNSLGVTYSQMGRHAEAVSLLEATLKKMKETLGPDHVETLMITSNLASAYADVGQLDRGLPLLEETLEIMKARLGPDHLETLRTMNNLGNAYKVAGKLDLALPLLEQALEKRKAELGPQHPHTLVTLNKLASAHQSAGRLDVALPLYEQMLKMQTAKLGPDHLDTLTAMNNLANAYTATGKLDEALPLHERTLQKVKATLGPDHAYTFGSMNNLASAYRAAGRHVDAEPLFREAVAGTRRTLGIGHSQTQTALQSLAGCYEDLKHPEKGEPLWRELTAFWREQAGPDSPQYSWKLVSLALNLLQQKRPVDAEPFLRESLAIREKTEIDVWATLQCRSFLGDCLLDQKKYADAEPLLVGIYEEMKAREARKPDGNGPGSSHPQRLSEALDRLIRLGEATNRPDDVKRWRDEKANLPIRLATKPLPAAPQGAVGTVAPTKEAPANEAKAADGKPPEEELIPAWRTLTGHAGPVWALAFSPDGAFLASGSDDSRIRIWDMKTDGVRHELAGHTAEIRSLTFAPDTGPLVSTSSDKTIRFWDPVTGRMTGMIDDTAPVYSPAVTGNGQILVTGSVESFVRVWSVPERKLIRRLDAGGPNAWAVAVSMERNLIATGGRDATIKIWDVAEGKLVQSFSRRSAAISSLAFSPDGQILASATGIVQLWNPDSGALLKELPQHKGTDDIAFTPDGKSLVTVGGDHVVRLWDVQNGVCLHSFAGGGFCVVVSPDGKRLASGGDDAHVRIWEVPAAKQAK